MKEPVAVSKPSRRRFLERLKRKKQERLGAERNIQRLGRSRAPLSIGQERLWFIDQLEAGSPRFNILSAIRFRGSLHPEAMSSSLNAIVDRHESLRTVFIQTENGPEQVVLPQLSVALPRIDLGEVRSHQLDRYLERFFISEVQRPIDLQRGPLVRWLLLRLGPEEHILCLLMHQIISDRWSRGIFVEEMIALYRAAVERRPADLPEPDLQFADFAIWQRQQAEEKEWQSDLDYWRDRLQGAPVLDWPSDRSRPSVSSYRGGTLFTSLSAQLLERLKAFSRERDITLFMTLLASVYALAFRYTDQRDVSMGAPIAQRSLQEVNRVIGFFLDMLAFRCRMVPGQSFHELAVETGRLTFEAFSHQAVPFEKVVAAVVEGRDMSRHPLFQTAVVLQNTPLPPLKLPELEISLVGVDWGTTAFDLSFFFWETGLWEGLDEGLSLTLTYSADLFDDTTIQRLCSHLEVLLRNALENPHHRLEDLPILRPLERHQLTCEWMGSSGSPDQAGASVYQVFAERAVLRGDRIALVAGCQGESVRTWQELSDESQALARRLRAVGVSSESPVVVCLPRGIEQITAFLAVLCADGFYVPVDPFWPADRLAWVAREIHAVCWITEAGFTAPEGVHSLNFLGREREEVESKTVTLSLIGPENLVYALYTSGSSGRPKAVAVTHGAILNLVRQTPGQELEEGMAQIAESFFDASTFEIWSALLNGSRLVIVDRQQSLSGSCFGWECSKDQRLGTALVTTPLFHLLAGRNARQFNGLRWLIFGGESASLETVRRVHEACPDVDLFQAYGPTEATVFTTLQKIGGCEEVWTSRGSVVLGRPISGARVALLDASFQPVPVGVIGEICLGGVGLARGYLERPGQTARAFVPDPTAEGERLYRTGDLGRWTSKGELVFCGRLDFQIQWRGYRLDPQEVEAMLLEDDGVAEAAVLVAQPPRRAESILLAHVVLHAALEAAEPSFDLQQKAQELLASLRRRLPVYMTPAAIVFREELPKAASGKLDRLALRISAQEMEPVSSRRVLPRNPQERFLADLFCQELDLEEVGVHDDFFQLGGHSLGALGVVRKLNQRYGLDVGVMNLFQHPTIAALAEQVESRSG